MFQEDIVQLAGAAIRLSHREGLALVLKTYKQSIWRLI